MHPSGEGRWEGADCYLRQMLSGKREAMHCTAVPWTRVPVIPVEMGPYETGGDIMAHLDHVSGYSIQLFEPYRLSDKRELTIGDTFAIDGAHAIFPTR